MKLEIEKNAGVTEVHVTLSRRNLLSLLHKVDMKDSARMMINNNAPEGYVLVAHCEDDEEHYDDPSRGAAQGFAGATHPETEEFVARHQDQEF